MRIVMITPVLFQETSPFNHLLKDLLEGLLEAGHEIIRIAACEKDSDTAYKLGLESSSITYIPVKRRKAGRGNILWRYMTDTWTAMKMARILRKINADILLEDVMYASFWPVSMARKKNMGIVSMIQDIWPDNAVQSGLLKKNSLLYYYFESWQKAVYRNSDALICISEDMKEFLLSKKIEKKKLKVIYNWGYKDECFEIPWEENEFVKKYQLNKEMFYVIYAGNIGRMQNVELLLQAAELLRQESDIRFLIVGEGVKTEEIREEIKAKKLHHTELIPFQPASLAPAVYSAAAVNVIPLLPGGAKTALPSKTGVCLSCGKPVIFCFGKDTQMAAICREYQAGISVSAQQANELAEAIKELKQDKKTDYKAGAKKLFQDKFRRSDNVKKYVKIIEKSLDFYSG